MPASHKFTRKLHEVIGDEATGAMVDWMNTTEDKLDQLHRDLAEFRQTVRADFAELRQEMNVGFAKLEAAVAQRHADAIRWMLGFWVASLITYVGVIVALAKVIR